MSSRDELAHEYIADARPGKSAEATKVVSVDLQPMVGHVYALSLTPGSSAEHHHSANRHHAPFNRPASSERARWKEGRLGSLRWCTRW